MPHKGIIFLTYKIKVEKNKLIDKIASTKKFNENCLRNSHYGFYKRNFLAGHQELQAFVYERIF